MPVVSATEARKNLFRLVDGVADSHEPVLIAGKRNRAVLISEDDCRAVQETLRLAQVPGMVASIQAGMATPVAECSEEPSW
jgi:prevent-host-death family protein